jgi:type I restriction enzyme S subunit
MAGSKGTKMPRGDKDWILQYPIVLPSPNHLKVFSKIGNSLKTGMNLKIKTNARLVQLADILLSKMATIEG